jgi:2-keto-4-pentenoate hydratase/2-oxohepta-3-ene-1,7-dioic acid hydratase in catechol pathway
VSEAATRLVRFDGGRTGLLLGPVVLDVEKSLPAFAEADPAAAEALAAVLGDGSDWLALLEAHDRLRAAIQALAAFGGSVTQPLDAVTLEPPIPSPHGRTFALGANFRSHVSGASAAIGVQDPLADGLLAHPPTGFFVIPGTIVGHEQPVAAPAIAQKFDYEAEVVVVLATGGRNLSPADVRFLGYSGWNDFSVRDPHLGLSELDRGALSWALQKNFDSGNACGPCLVAGGDVDFANIPIRSSVNGAIRQDGSTADMIRSFADAVAYVSQYLTVSPGDLFTSGTPGGTAIEQGIDGPYLRPGDVVEIEVGDAGVLRNVVREGQ